MNIIVKCPNKLPLIPGSAQKTCDYIFTVTVNDNMTNIIRCPNCRRDIYMKTLRPSRWRQVVDSPKVDKVTIIVTVTHTSMSRGGSVRGKYSAMLTKKLNRRIRQ